MKVKDVMNSDFTLITPSATLKEASERMAHNGIGFLPVGENDRLQGTVTDRDLVIRGLSKGKDVESCKIEEVYTDDIFFCHENDDVNDAAQKMKTKQVRRLPVVNENNRLVGVVSIGDMAQHIDQGSAGDILQSVTA